VNEPLASHGQRKTLYRVCGQILVGLQQMAAQVGEECPFSTPREVYVALKHAAKVKTTKGLTRRQMYYLTEWMCAWAGQRAIEIELKSKELTS
jgi:hypothetical protein